MLKQWLVPLSALLKVRIYVGSEVLIQIDSVQL